ncbi:hypothetical protein TNCV_2500341 [Trichonephila clavipes]|nr:hypothetical protein TNCV_2500341 [Trichonephila clavipes]
MYDVEGEELEPDPTDKFAITEYHRNNPDKYIRALTPKRFRKRCHIAIQVLGETSRWNSREKRYGPQEKKTSHSLTHTGFELTTSNSIPSKIAPSGSQTLNSLYKFVKKSVPVRPYLTLQYQANQQ